MSFIEKSVARLDQQDRLEALAVELGKSHYHYNAPPKYYSVRPQWPPNKKEHTWFFWVQAQTFIHWHNGPMHKDCTLKQFSIISQYVGAEFICAVQPILKERCTSELKEAWKVRRFWLDVCWGGFDACNWWTWAHWVNGNVAHHHVLCPFKCPCVASTESIECLKQLIKM